MHMSLDTDFSIINYQYLLKVRDIAKQEPDLVVALLGVPKELVVPLANTPTTSLTPLAHIKEPLITLRVETWWWERFIKAVNDGRQEEIDAVIEHASFIGTSPSGGMEQ